MFATLVVGGRITARLPTRPSAGRSILDDALEQMKRRHGFAVFQDCHCVAHLLFQSGDFFAIVLVEGKRKIPD
jgi:N-formylglutamate amidohydrolase